MPKGSLNMSLKGADDIFSTEESRQEQQREQVQQFHFQSKSYVGGVRRTAGLYRSALFQPVQDQLRDEIRPRSALKEVLTWLRIFPFPVT